MKGLGFGVEQARTVYDVAHLPLVVRELLEELCVCVVCVCVCVLCMCVCARARAHVWVWVCACQLLLVPLST